MASPQHSRGSKLIPVVLMCVTGLLVLGLVLLVRIPEAPATGPVRQGKANIGVLRLDTEASGRLLRQEALLRDPAPLFLPTEWNAAMYVRPGRSIQRPGEAFGGFPAKYVFGGGSMPLALPPPVSIPGEPAGALEHMSTDRPFVGLGESTLTLARMPDRGVCVEVQAAGSGELFVRTNLERPLRAGTPPWQPARFMVQCDAVGLVGRPSLIVSSGVEAVDAALENLVRQQWPGLSRQGHLQPGCYRIILGP